MPPPARALTAGTLETFRHNLGVRVLRVVECLRLVGLPAFLLVAYFVWMTLSEPKRRIVMGVAVGDLGLLFLAQLWQTVHRLRFHVTVSAESIDMNGLSVRWDEIDRV